MTISAVDSWPAASSASVRTNPSFPLTLWRITVRYRDRTPPFDVALPFEIRALSEAMARERVAARRPDLEILAVERRPTA